MTKRSQYKVTVITRLYLNRAQDMYSGLVFNIRNDMYGDMCYDIVLHIKNRLMEHV